MHGAKRWTRNPKENGPQTKLANMRRVVSLDQMTRRFVFQPQPMNLVWFLGIGGSAS